MPWKRPPTAKGTSFLRLEDPDGIVDVIVPPKVYADCREALRSAFIIVEGVLRKSGVTITVVAGRVAPLP